MSDSGDSDLPTPPYTSLAILGATGQLGSYFLKALSEHPLAPNLTIHLLTRRSSPNLAVGAKLISSHPDLAITLYEIEYNQGEETEKQLEKALKGIEVVISAVGDPSLHGDAEKHEDIKHCGELPSFQAQEAVAKAAKKAGAKLFVPSEYGYPTHTIPADSPMFLVGKRLFLDLLREDLELPWMVVYAGTLRKVEPSATPLPPCSSSTTLPDPPFLTTRYHLASWVIHLILDVLPEMTTWGIFRILGVRRDVLTEEDDGEDWELYEG